MLSSAPVLVLSALALLALVLEGARGLPRGRQSQRTPTRLPDFKYRKFELPEVCGEHMVDTHSANVFRARGGRIAGTREYKRNEIPSVVQVISFDSQRTRYCTGTLIHPSVVITSARCLYRMHDVFVIPSHRFVSHPKADLGSYLRPKFRAHYACYMAGGHNHDVAMIVLQGAVPMNPFNAVACLDSAVLPLDQVAFSVGYGLANESPRKWPKHMRALKVKRTDDCAYKHDTKMSCYVPANDEKPPFGCWCNGDEGGPVFRIDSYQERFYLTGVIYGTSATSSCDDKNSTMTGYATNFAPANLTHVHKWLSADPAAYNTQCFKTKYEWY